MELWTSLTMMKKEKKELEMKEKSAMSWKIPEVKSTTTIHPKIRLRCCDFDFHEQQKTRKGAERRRKEEKKKGKSEKKKEKQKKRKEKEKKKKTEGWQYAAVFPAVLFALEPDALPSAALFSPHHAEWHREEKQNCERPLGLC